MPHAPYRIGMVGGSSLRGQELASALRERSFPALPPRLFQAEADPGEDTRGLVEFGGEPAVAEPLTPEAVGELDLLFLAGSAGEAQLAWGAAAASATPVVDLSAGLAGVEGAVVVGMEPAAAPEAPMPPVLVVAHPAAQALAWLLARLAPVGRLETVAATVFEPSSERDREGLRELEQQTTRLLAVQSLPQSVYGTQVAFNLRAALGAEARPSLDDIRARMARELEALRHADAGNAVVWPQPALQLLQAPLFHASVISLYLRWTSPPALAAVQRALHSSWTACGGEFPDVVVAAGEDAIQLGPPRLEPDGGVWVFAVLDNLRRAAFAAVDAAAAWLAVSA